MATLSLNKTTITIITIYRPPNFEYITFYSDFSDIIHTYSSHNNLIVLGAFNFHFDSNLKQHLHFKLLCNELNLLQYVNFPTHTHGHTLDLILTLDTSNIIKKNY